MTDSTEIGRFGTLRLLKRHHPDTTVAVFPIDDEVVTFGRSKQCSVRLYYDCVSELHCTLQISEQRKAFLLVQGTNGLLVDGCQVNPSTSRSSPTTVPLTNGSEIEIYKKLFKFEYPPKNLRAALLATPRHGKSQRSLRMSLIRSAQVITPRSSPHSTPRRGNIKDNLEWEALRSPVKVSGNNNDIQEVMLLEGQGDDAVVVEEERDLIILEQVEDRSKGLESTNRERPVTASLPKNTPPHKAIPPPQSMRGARKAPHTPPIVRRRSAPSLHRAVVLRLAQRALERERYEEQQEEDEVEAVVSPERELGPLEFSDDESEDDDKEDLEELDRPAIPSSTAAQSSGGRLNVIKAGLGVMKKALPLSFTWKSSEEVPLPREEEGGEGEEEGGEEGEDGEEKDEDMDEDEEQCEGDEDQYDEDDLVITAQPHTPVPRNLGPFMTPQVMLNRPAQRVPVGVKARASIGGEGVPQMLFGGAQRIRTVSPWKIQDIVLPEPEKERVEEKQNVRNRITEEERQAIRARRQSALQSPNPLPIPGPRGSTFPSRRSDIYTPGEDKDEDAETMLENMKHKMAHFKQQSEARKIRLSITSPHKGQDFSLLKIRRGSRAFPAAGIEEETSSQTRRAALDDDEIADNSALGSGGAHHAKEGHELNGSNDAMHILPAASGSISSLTPRFSGEREMSRHPNLEPKTPSHAGFKGMMFQGRREVSHNTPSFRGVREMFHQPHPNGVPATPQLNLGTLFIDEEDDEETDNVGSHSEDELENLHSGHTLDDCVIPEDNDNNLAATAIKTEADGLVDRDPALGPNTNRRSRKPSRNVAAHKQDVAVVNIPIAEDDMDQGDMDGLGHQPVTTRRTTKRTVNRTKTPAADDAVHLRATRKGVYKGTAGASKATAVRKGTRTRAEIVESSDEDSEHVAPAGEGGSVTRGQPVSDNSKEVKNAISRKTRAVGSSDVEELAVPKARRGRTPKIEQPEVFAVEAPVATRGTRRVKADDTSGNGGVLPTAKPKARRGAKAKTLEAMDEDGPAEVDEALSEQEEVSPASSKSKRGKGRKPGTLAFASQDRLSDDGKENNGKHQRKTAAGNKMAKGRKTPMAVSAEALDAPAKRTRSRK